MSLLVQSSRYVKFCSGVTAVVIHAVKVIDSTVQIQVISRANGAIESRDLSIVFEACHARVSRFSNVATPARAKRP